MSIKIFGIRHHGPGSARNVLQALKEMQPDILLIEGPPEGNDLLKWTNHKEMRPPVAMLAYVPDDPQNAVFYPFTDFSPEWQAISYGMKNKIPVRFMDMPLVNKLAIRKANAEAKEDESQDETDEKTDTLETDSKEAVLEIPPVPIPVNPIKYLAEAAGYDDPEEWWEQHFETVAHPSEIFEVITDAMAALRESHPKDTEEERIREAFMRRAIRLAEREMYTNIAVICGAWHSPALKNMPTKKSDDEILKNLPKTKIETTWIPWTNNRLTFESGYGAGVDSPGWYEHNWKNPNDDGTLWLTKAARVFRKNQYDISSAHIIETVRLCTALIEMRDLHKPGLNEFNESIQTVMCLGASEPLVLIKKDLIVGERIGNVPDGTPRSPLQKDFENQLKKLRLKISQSDQELKLDLREAAHLKKSILLHRLKILGVNWGEIVHAAGKGTFKEAWRLYWKPEMMITLIEKAAWGNTIESACNKYVTHDTESADQLDLVVKMLNTILPAELPQATEALIKKMDVLASSTSDISALADAINPLVELFKYGNVRNTDRTLTGFILDSIFHRMVIGLPTSLVGIDEAQAADMANRIINLNKSVQVLDNEDFSTEWIDTLFKITNSEQTVPFVAGTCVKILYEARQLEKEEAATAFSRALSINNPPEIASQWLEGFLKDSAMILILDNQVWNIVYGWVDSLEEEVFNNTLPLLRRTFATFSTVEKQKIGAKVKSGIQKTDTTVSQITDIDVERAVKVIPVLEELLGL